MNGTLGAIVADIVRTAEDRTSVKTSVFGTSSGLLRDLLKAGWRVEESKCAFVYLSSAGPPRPNYFSHAAWLP
jgi:hypothetical protein